VLLQKVVQSGDRQGVQRRVGFGRQDPQRPPALNVHPDQQPLEGSGIAGLEPGRLGWSEKAPATRKAYATDFRLFKVYCDAKGVSALPAAPETVASYIAAEAQTAKPSTIGRRIAAIRYAHKLAGLETPTDAEGVRATMRGIRRTFGTARNKKAPAVAAKIRSMVATAPEGLAGLRDRALLLLGFAGAFRRSELVALDVADTEETETGMLVTIRGSKTDQERQGVTIAIARGDIACPVKALRAWLDAAGIEAGPLFRPIDKAGTVAASSITVVVF
jgi:integrase